MKQHATWVSIVCSAIMLACMAVVIVPKGLWHHHEESVLHSNDDHSHEEDCAVCDYVFSGFSMDTETVEFTALVEHQTLLSFYQTHVTSNRIIAHTGLAPPSIA